MTVLQENRNVETRGSDEGDPVLSMLGVGRELWALESGDRLVERLRSEEAPPVSASPANVPTANIADEIWARIERYQGEEFYTASQLPVTFRVEGNGIWFFREGRLINRKATRTQVEVAISRCPLKTTTEIRDLIDYPYLFAVLMDRRIRGKCW
jgi:hypothetical protein